MIAILLSIFSGLNMFAAPLNSITLPFEYSGNLLLLKGSVNGHSGYFALDTGAELLVLNKSYVRSSTEIPETAFGDVGGHSHTVSTTSCHDLTLGTFQFKNYETHVSDLTSIENARNIKVLGLLGIGFIKPFDITIDIQSKTVTFRGNHSHKIGSHDNDYLFKIPFKLVANTVLLEAQIGENDLRMQFDTGAEHCVLTRKDRMRANDYFRHKRYSTVINAGSRISPVLDGTLNSLSIGDLYFSEIRVISTNLKQPVSASLKSRYSVIGHDFLRSGIVTIDFRSREITVYPFKSSPDDAITKKAAIKRPLNQ